MSWKVGVKTAQDHEWVFNALRFETEKEANMYATNLFLRWTAVTETHVEQCADEVNTKFPNPSDRYRVQRGPPSESAR